MRMNVRALCAHGMLLGAAALASLEPASALAANAAECDRACLNGIAEQYLTALPTHDPKRAPLWPEARYTENGVELSLPDGLWRTASSVGKYRLYALDPVTGSVGVFAKAEENGVPVLVATRLAVFDHKISEIETVVARSSDRPGSGAGEHPRPDSLGDAPREQFLQTVPHANQRPREEMINIVNTYFTGIENNDGSRPPLFADDCNRIENGSYTTNRPMPKEGEPNGANYSCKKAFALGYYHEDTRLRDRRILAIDQERGLVYTAMFIDHDASIRSYKTHSGSEVKVQRTAPWTWMAQEVFQINNEGHISQVEAVLLSVPYGMRPGWQTGIHMPSPAAARDHFRE